MTVGYDTATADLLWSKSYGGGDSDTPSDIAVSPDGSTVFVTGYHTVDQADFDFDWATVAYDAETGAKIWGKKYDGPATDFSTDEAVSLVVSPDGASVCVSGFRANGFGGETAEMLTIAYSADAGAKLWDHTQPGTVLDTVLSPNGSKLYLVGSSFDPTIAMTTVALDTATGDPHWTKRWRKASDQQSQGTAIATAPGGRVFVTGQTYDSPAGYTFATVAYRASDGQRQWVKGYDGDPDYSDDVPSSIAAPPTDRPST